MITDKDVVKLKNTFATKEELHGEIGSLAASTKREFDNVYERLDHLELRFDNLEKRFDSLEKRFDVLEKRFDILELKIDRMDRKMDQKFDLVLGMISSLGNQSRTHETWIRHIAGESNIQLPEAS